ncbi:glycosyltransferase [Shewanella marisflavi]|uniref:glycosyltransferase family 2 protein n=1 Tax=Shewanella marisflavi TaxID=260364 RepID=UPI002010215F|nr:glycosyltransferase [Shewanella marisflavi]MCL1040840.1 glycosyltransferase [Shewanella marisflavi]
MSPSLTICIPNFNHGDLLEQTLDAVFAQELEGIQVLVSDNASNDNSVTKINKFSGQAQLKVLHQDSTIPMASHWNAVAKSADTPWIVMLCSDDVLLPGAISKLMKAAQNPDVQAIFFEYDFLIDQKRVTKTPFYESSAIISGKQQAEIFLKGNNFPLSACMFKRDLIEKIGWFDEGKQFCTDWHAWLHMSAAANQVLYIKEPLLLYRHHAANETHRCVRDLVALEEVIAMKTDFMAEYATTNKDVLHAACANNLKLAKHYASQMISQGITKAASHYQHQTAILEKQLRELGSNSKTKSTGAPYPLPYGAKALNSQSLCLT